MLVFDKNYLVLRLGWTLCPLWNAPLPTPQPLHSSTVDYIELAGRAGQQCSIPTPPFTQSTLFASCPNFPSLHFVSPNICLSHKSRIPKCFLPPSNFLYALASSPAPGNHKFKATEKMWCYKRFFCCCFQYILLLLIYFIYLIHVSYKSHISVHFAEWIVSTATLDKGALSANIDITNGCKMHQIHQIYEKLQSLVILILILPMDVHAQNSPDIWQIAF